VFSYYPSIHTFIELDYVGLYHHNTSAGRFLADRTATQYDRLLA